GQRPDPPADSWPSPLLAAWLLWSDHAPSGYRIRAGASVEAPRPARAVAGSGSAPDAGLARRRGGIRPRQAAHCASWQWHGGLPRFGWLQPATEQIPVWP